MELPAGCAGRFTSRCFSNCLVRKTIGTTKQRSTHCSMIANHIYSSSQFYRQEYLDCEDDAATVQELTDFRVHLLYSGYEPFRSRASIY